MLAVEEPFSSIFKEMWKFEQINREIELTKSGIPQVCAMAHSLAIEFYKIAADKESHKKLLLLFMSEQEIEDLDKKRSKIPNEG